MMTLNSLSSTVCVTRISSSLRTVERGLKFPVAALCLYEALAITLGTRRMPTVTSLAATHKRTLPVIISGLIYLHLVAVEE